MPLKFFGTNRMAAQQGVEDSGSSLVRNRPSWGMGPQNMPGSFDYNPKTTESSRGGQGGPVERAPNAYERGGFFWTGNSVAQGTPIAHQDQRQRLAENEDVRRYAKQALEDKKHNLNVRDVDSRIRMADRGFNENVRQADQRFGLDERKFGADVRIADRGFNENVRQADQRFGLDERKFGADVRMSAEQAKAKQMAAREKGFASSRPDRWYSVFESLNEGRKDDKGQPIKALIPEYGMMNGKQNASPEFTMFTSRLDNLALDPRLKDVDEMMLARMAAEPSLRYATLPDGSEGFVYQHPEQGWVRVNLQSAPQEEQKELKPLL